MNTKHTPGPWTFLAKREVKEKYYRGQEAFIHGQSQFKDGRPTIHVATVRAETILDSELDANANLIAAAPELLEACKVMLAWMQNCALDTVTTTPNAVSECQAAKAAIAKATGE